jgi:ribulose 1,5-bisphosphate synthetase/thiazole synthase
MRPVRAVVIVGGGTAGRLAAGIIAARHQARMKAGGLSVTLIESPVRTGGSPARCGRGCPRAAGC